jgi:predicted XRE-type DNA-binding protein
MSALKDYKLAGFSLERLMTFLNALGQDVEIVSPGHGNRRASRSLPLNRVA